MAVQIFEYNGSALPQWWARTATPLQAIEGSVFSFRQSPPVSREFVEFTISSLSASLVSPPMLRPCFRGFCFGTNCTSFVKTGT
ncbi:unnamed protein product [Prunus armeniaca]|uniref:Uncharacterized protein n=1 Tax=Prunus armeniaca TaxID=36596 RepID=A0A6J5VEU0_PRUAR|nr:unnamed protein product [Prunus armeniaca]